MITETLKIGEREVAITMAEGHDVHRAACGFAYGGVRQFENNGVALKVCAVYGLEGRLAHDTAQIDASSDGKRFVQSWAGAGEMRGESVYVESWLDRGDMCFERVFHGYVDSISRKVVQIG